MSSFEVMNEIQGKIILGAYIALPLWTAEQSRHDATLNSYYQEVWERKSSWVYNGRYDALQYANDFWGNQAYVFDIKFWLLIIDA